MSRKTSAAALNVKENETMSTERAAEIWNEAVKTYNPIAKYALFSGGHDSLAVTAWAMEMGADAAVHVNTGIGIEQTRMFVRRTCKREGWPLKEYHAGKPYAELVKQYGFPGPGAHLYMYSWLKERGIRQLIRETKNHRMDKVMLITGVRSQESRRRMGNVAPIAKEDAKIWVAPFIDMSKIDVNKYIKERGLPSNPVVDKLHMSGECLCGAYAHPGELAEIEYWYPETAAHIRQLEKMAQEYGHDGDWESRNKRKAPNVKTKSQMLCTDCNAYTQGERNDVD